MMDKLGQRFAEKCMGSLAYVRLNINHQWALSTVSQDALNEMQHSSFSKSRYCLQLWAPQHSKDTQANELRGSPMVNRNKITAESTCTAARAFLHFFSHRWVRGLGLHTRNWEGTQMGQQTPTNQKDIPAHTATWSADRAGGRRSKWEMFRVVLFVLPTFCYMLWSPNSLEMTEHLPENEKCWINSLVLLCLCVWFFLHLSDCLYFNPRVF